MLLPLPPLCMMGPFTLAHLVSGFFTVGADSLANGLYLWRTKGVKNLAITGTVTLAEASTTQQEMGQQPAGDAATSGPTNFNVVNASDFTTL